MAWLEKKPSGQFLVSFRIGATKVAASTRLARIEETIGLIETGRITLPAGVDVVSFVMSDGKLTAPFKPPTVLSIATLEKRFKVNLPTDHIEKNTLSTINTHMRHIRRVLGGHRQIDSVDLSALQSYVNTRAEEPGSERQTDTKGENTPT